MADLTSKGPRIHDYKMTKFNLSYCEKFFSDGAEFTSPKSMKNIARVSPKEN